MSKKGKVGSLEGWQKTQVNMSDYRVKPITREDLHRVLGAKGVVVPQGQDVTAVASQFLADHAATAAAHAPQCASEDYKTGLSFAASQLRQNPFKNAPGEAVHAQVLFVGVDPQTR
jgi:hypothetical protein